jgi:subtilisin family serine protease
VAAYDALRAVGTAAIESLLHHELIRKALGQTIEQKARRRRASISEAELPAFWSSRSVAVTIDKDDLARLPAAVPRIREIAPNRPLRLPRPVEVKNLPPRLLEERASDWGLNTIGALAVWGAYGARGSEVTVAILDTGVDAEHPDLRGKVAAWAEFDGDGYPVPGSEPHDAAQHGTHCAGTIAGGNASGRWIGVAPAATIAAALVLDEQGGTDAQLLAGLDWAIERRVDVINLSLGGLTLGVEPPDPYTQALLSAVSVGIPVVTAVGNEGSQTTGSPGNDWFSLSVGATDYLDRPAGFSGGRTHVVSHSRYLRPELLPLVYSKPELSAPGVAITSAVPGGGWKTFNGTSMATPHVAGAVALLLSATAIRDHVQERARAFLIEDLLVGAVEELGEAGQDHRYGFGRLDILRAVGFAKERGY